MINVDFLATGNRQVSGYFTHNLSAHLGKALGRPRELRAVSLELQLQHIYLLQDHVHRLVIILVELLAHSLNLRIQELSGFGIAMLRELRLDFLATPRHAFSQDSLVISHIFA